MTPQDKIDAAKKVIDLVEQEDSGKFNNQIEILILALHTLMPGIVIKTNAI